MSNRV